MVLVQARRPARGFAVGAALAALAVLARTAAAGLTTGTPATAAPKSRAVKTAPPPVGHVFVINLENKGYDETFGPDSPAPYLSKALTAQGQLLTRYYGTPHNSLPNHIAQLSGQGPNPQTQADCQVYSDFVQNGTVTPEQAVGEGCVYPESVKTVADQLEAKGLTWKAYMEDMGTPCRQNDVDLSQLPGDLVDSSTTANLTYITPNLCNDGHDSPCVDGRPGGLVRADEWLRTWGRKSSPRPPTSRTASSW